VAISPVRSPGVAPSAPAVPSQAGSPGGVRIGVVLSAGGLRGVAHLGVMRQLVAHGVPIDVLVGVSAGAIIAGYYAAVGLTIEDMIGDAPTFHGRHLLMHGVTLRAPGFLKPALRRFCGVIPTRLAQLEAARYERLHHGVQALGIVCHDLVAGGPMYFSPAEQHGVPLAVAVRGSAAVPGLIPTRPAIRNGRRVHLVDGGLSDALPCAFARERLGATHLIVSDCRRAAADVPRSENLVYIRPDLEGAATFRSPSGTLAASVERGMRACTPEAMGVIRGWREATRQRVAV
jgi:predicted acylesterase/phospholipase RssA